MRDEGGARQGEAKVAGLVKATGAKDSCDKDDNNATITLFGGGQDKGERNVRAR